MLSVIAAHAGLPAAPGGFVGVDIFFVISGYVITRSIRHESRVGTFSLPLASSSINETDSVVRVRDGNIVAIGGLNADNMDVLAHSPIAGVAIVSAVMKADDPRAAAAHIREKVLAMRK